MIACESEQTDLKLLKDGTSEGRHEFAVPIAYDGVRNVPVVTHELRKHYIGSFHRIVGSFAWNKQYSFRKLVRNDKKRI